MFKKTTVTFLIIAISSMLAGCSTQEEVVEEVVEEIEPLRVALVMATPINDAGWGASAYNGLMSAKENLGVEVSYMESVPNSDNEEVFRSYAEDGFDVIIGHGFQYGDAALLLSEQYPDTKFVITAASYAMEPNVCSVNLSNKEAGYLDGVIAGIFTETDKVAFIAGVKLPPIIHNVNGFIEGVGSVNPDADISTTYIGSWDDVTKAKELTIAYIQAGTDIVGVNAAMAGLGVIEGAMEQSKYAIGFIADQSDLAPDTVIASVILDYGVAIEYLVKEIQNGTYESIVYTIGSKDNGVSIAWNEQLKGDLDSSKVQETEEIYKKIVDGDIDVESLIGDAEL
jgi:basic membrane protein A